MSTSVGQIHYDLDLNTQGFDKAVSGIASKTQAIGSKMKDVGQSMTLGITLPVVAGAALAVKAASDLNETINKVDVAFKDQADTVKEWSKTSIQSMGLARQSALDATALFGDMATSMGLNTAQAAEMSMKLTQLGADLASFKNISFAEAQTALAGVFTGETESLKRLGIVMTETNLEAYALARGITKPIQEMSQSEKVQLRFAYIMEQTKNAQGDFSRTSQGTANQIRITQEKFKELAATIGQELLPTANKLLDWAQKLTEAFGKLTPEQQKITLMLTAFAAAIGPILIVIGSLIGAIGNIISAFGVLKIIIMPILSAIGAGVTAIAAALSLPVAVVVAIIAAIVALGVAIYFAIKNWDKITAAIGSFISLVSGGDFMGAFREAFGLEEDSPIVVGILAVRNSIINLYNGVISFFGAIPGFVSNAINQTQQFLMKLPETIAYVIGYMAGRMVRFFVIDIPSFLTSAATALLNFATVTIPSFFNSAVSWFQQLPGRVASSLSAMASAVSGWFANAWNTAVSTASSLVKSVGNFFRQLPSIAANVVSKIVAFFATLPSRALNAIGDFAGQIYNRLRSVAGAAWEGFKKGLGIHSPSYIEEAFMAITRQGKQTVQDLNKSMDQLNSVAATSADAAVSGAYSQQALAGSRGMGVNASTSIYGNVNISSQQDADYFFNRMNRTQDFTSMGLAS